MTRAGQGRGGGDRSRTPPLAVRFTPGLRSARKVARICSVSARDSRVALGIVDPASPLRSWAIRGHVLSTSTEGAREHLDGLSTKYLGRPYPGFGGSGGGQRVVVTIAVDSVRTP